MARLIVGSVDYQPGLPIDDDYADAQSYLAYVPMQVVGLDELGYQAGTMDSFPFRLPPFFQSWVMRNTPTSCVDASAALPPEATTDLVPKMTTILVGIAGTGEIGGRSARKGWGCQDLAWIG